jgi:hypothetical protein
MRCSLIFKGLSKMTESQSAPLPRSEFTSMEEEIFSDLSGERTQKMITQIQARSGSWQSKQTESNKDLVGRGVDAMGDCISILESVWQSVHNRSLST